MTEELKERLMALHLGSHESEATRAKISAAKMGRGKSLEACANMSAAEKGRPAWNKGIPMSSVAKMKASAAHMGNRVNLGRIFSLETRAKLSVAGKGRVSSPEKRAKISAANWKGGFVVSRPKHAAKRRALGFTPLNSWFPGCEGHHINKTDVIYLPRKLHRSISHNQWTGRNMDKINALAGQYLTEDWT